MPDLNPVYDLIGRVMPFDCMEMQFMRKALLALLLLSPAVAASGVQVVNFRMSFFADAISHSAFAGVAIGLILGIDPHWTMPTLALAIGFGIMAVQRRTSLSIDTVIGVFFSAVVAFGLAAVSRERGLARQMQAFLYGDILTIGDGEILALAVLSFGLMCFHAFSYNRLSYIGLDPLLARTHGVKAGLYQYLHSGLLSLLVMFSVWAVGVLLVTALLVVPAAAGRNFARTSGGTFWCAQVVAAVSAVAGLLISAQDWARTASGATVILCACVIFALSMVWRKLVGTAPRI